MLFVRFCSGSIFFPLKLIELRDDSFLLIFVLQKSASKLHSYSTIYHFVPHKISISYRLFTTLHIATSRPNGSGGDATASGYLRGHLLVYLASARQSYIVTDHLCAVKLSPGSFCCCDAYTLSGFSTFSLLYYTSIYTIFILLDYFFLLFPPDFSQYKYLKTTVQELRNYFISFYL